VNEKSSQHGSLAIYVLPLDQCKILIGMPSLFHFVQKLAHVFHKFLLCRGEIRPFLTSGLIESRPFVHELKLRTICLGYGDL